MKYKIHNIKNSEFFPVMPKLKIRVSKSFEKNSKFQIHFSQNCFLFFYFHTLKSRISHIFRARKRNEVSFKRKLTPLYSSGLNSEQRASPFLRHVRILLAISPDKNKFRLFSWGKLHRLVKFSILEKITFNMQLCNPMESKSKYIYLKIKAPENRL